MVELVAPTSFAQATSASSLRLTDKVGGYEFTVKGQGIDLTLTSQAAGMSLDGKTIAQEMHSRVDPWRWPVEVFRDHDETASLVASYQTTELADALAAAAAEVNATAEPPVSATVTHEATSSGVT